MRLTQKKQILDGIETLKKANRKLKLIQYGFKNEMLQQCQELAIAIGNQIEKIEKDNSVTINYLEEYCELLYKAFICENKGEYKQLIKDVNISLKKIEKSIKEDIKNSPHEIVFMPYKASMWDSMDSVYRAAQRDPSCHVVVMPVPYYNPNQKENRIEMHYEGDMFPEDVPITDFRVYSLEEIHPEAIIIHNPYDQCNYVTQLPEEYFSSNLIKYTERLVYIPYFITKGDKIKKDYCVMPAVKNAWRTFVQSEGVRNCYVKYGADSNKIIAMGSPKFDMVVKMQRNPPEIPQGWKDVMKGRKTFFLNTHLNPIINEAEKLIDKLHRIFTLFRLRKDVALLWRPHPLSIETAKSMNPQILEKYLELIEEFKTLDNGVYDDTADIHRAIAISDAYIGDWSSVATLYGITGKPMYIMNIKANTNVEETEIERKQKERGIAFSCAVELDGYLWAPGDEFNALFRICEKTGESRFVTAFCEEDFCGCLLYRKVVAFRRKLFFIPGTAKHVAEYNVDTEEMKYYDIYNSQDKLSKFGGYAVKGNKLYLFPLRATEIVCINMDNGEVRQFDWNYKLLPEGLNHESSLFLNEINISNIEYMPCLQSNIFIKLHMDDLYAEVINFSETNEGLIDVVCEKDILYFLSTRGNIFTYNMSTNEEKHFWVSNEKKLADQTPYHRLLVYGGYIWLLPADVQNICRIDLKSGKADEILEYPEGLMFSHDHLCKWFNGEVRRGKLYLYPRGANMMLKWDGVREKPKGVKIAFPNCKEWITYKFQLDKCDYLYHEANLSLFCFLDIILSENDGSEKLRRKYFNELQCYIEGNCGENIWKYLKGNLDKINVLE